MATIGPPLAARVDRNLLLEFFLTFARFEYALKNTDFFVRLPENALRAPLAKPDWDRFAGILEGVFNLTKTDALLRACQYLLDSPPNKQVIINGFPAWETPVREAGLSDIRFLLLMVRSIRNNLFHGGKHNIEVHESRERTEALLRAALVILGECLVLAPDQERAFEQAVL